MIVFTITIEEIKPGMVQCRIETSAKTIPFTDTESDQANALAEALKGMIVKSNGRKLCDTESQ